MAKHIDTTSFFRIIRILLATLGIIFLIMLAIALTPIPFYMQYGLGKDPNEKVLDPDFKPDHIVMFGGAGMPSESNLIRLFYASRNATHYNIPIVIVHPEDKTCQQEMKRFLVQDSVPEADILFMTQGTNTRSQVLELAKAYPELVNGNLLVITSPENMRRTIKSMNKAGFTHVKGVAAWEATVDFNLSLNKQDLKGNEAIPSVESTNIRYTFWNYFQLEIVCFREYAALAYYKIKGWI